MNKSLLVILFLTTYIFSFAQLSEQALPAPSELNDPTNVFTPKLGYAVDVSDNGEVMVLGAPDYEDGISPGNDYGGIVVFRKDASGDYVEEQFISPVDTATFSLNRFGYSVALNASGNKLVVGSPFYCDGDAQNGCNGPADLGRVYVFDYNGSSWDLEANFSTNSTTPNFNIGFSVDISDDGSTIVAGAPGWSNFTPNPVFTIGGGAAFVYVDNAGTWEQDDILVSSDVANEDTFGYDVSISGDGNTILVGATEDGGGGEERMGAAYAFRKNPSWAQEHKFAAVDGNGEHLFGHSVALSDDGDTAIVGAPGNNKAYVYTFSSSWSQSTQLTASSSVEFGFSVDITGDATTAAIGDPGFNSNRGIGYLYSTSLLNFNNVTDLVPMVSTPNGQYGYDIAVSDGAFETAVGAPNVIGPQNTTGQASAFLFPRTTLPVELVSFTAMHEGDLNVKLAWSTASEDNNEGFEIERSTNGLTWQYLGFVDGATNSATTNNYNFSDVVPTEGNYLYRLKQVDFNGDFTYSDVAQVSIEVESTGVLVFNPVRNDILLTAEATTRFRGGVAVVVDMQGRVVYEGNVGSNSLDVSSLSAGTYVLALRSPNGSTSVKIVKQ